MADTMAPKKQRNYVIELFKVFWALLVVIAHVVAQLTFPLGLPPTTEATFATNPGLEYSFFYAVYGEVLGISGYLTIGIFCFLSGYGLVNEFKKNQRRGVVGKGKDVAIIGKLAVRNWSSYVPYFTFGVGFSFILYHVIFPAFRDFKVIVAHFVTSFFQFVGIYGFGEANVYKGAQFSAGLTENHTVNVISTLFEWNGPLWYMFALTIFGVVIYALLVANEKLTVFVIGPVIFSIYTLVGQSATVLANIGTYGIYNKGLIICGMLFLGVWGWYITDWLKKQEFSHKGKIGLSVLLVFFVGLLVYNFVFYYAGMNYTDMVATFVFIIVLAEKDYITVGLNKFLNKLPFMKYASTLSLGLYCTHFPVMCVFRVMKDIGGEFTAVNDWFFGHNVDQITLIIIGLTFVACIPFFVYDKFVAKKFIAWFQKATKVNEPVIINEEVK